MDSNFRVKIDVDISDLNNRLKAVEATLKQFGAASDNAAASTKKLEQEANRGRLVAFAFGQVLRDAGFFAQDFRLGILAISNNIPILIDQLVLLSGVSKAVGATISLIGSLLTAGLTIWAYSASGVDKYNQALQEYQKSLNDSRASAEGEILTLKTLLAIASDQTKSLGQRQDAINQINQGYKAYNNELTINNVNSEKNKSITDRLTSSILLQAQATAEAANYTKLLGQLYEIQDTPLEKQVSLLEEIGIRLKEGAGNAFDLITSFGKFDAAGAIQSINDKLKNKGMEKYADAFRKLSPAIDASKLRLQQIIDQITKQETATGKATKATYDFAKALSESKKNLFDTAGIEFLPEDYRQKNLDEIADFYGELQDLVDEKLGPLGTGDAITEAVAPLYVPFDKQKGEENYKLWKENFDRITQIYEDFNNNLDQIFISGTVNILSSGAEAIGEALAKGGNVAEAAGKALWTSFATILQQLGQLAIQTGLTIQAIKSAIKSLNPFVAIAAGTALIALAGYIRGRVSKIGDQMGSGTTAFANGGIVSGPTNALVGEYAGARSNPEVIAPLDKLQSIIGNSMGGNEFGAVIAETRISGNDLSILLKRADKNRGEYF